MKKLIRVIHKGKEPVPLADGSGYKINYYPDKDRYIPDACAIADEKMLEHLEIKEIPKYEPSRFLRIHNEWQLFFLAAMDDILESKGMRVL